MANHPGNRFVDYLVALRTQTDTGNVFCVHEARGSADILSRFGLAPGDTHVRTKLDTLVEDATRSDFPFRIVFLTGDAGDGKTATCEALAERLLRRQLSEQERGQARFEIDRDDGSWTILKDASELNATDNPTLNFEEILARECVPSAPRRLFVAVNEGRLRAACRRVRARNPWIWSRAVEPALAAREGSSEHLELAERVMRESGVLVVNLRDRCLPADPGTFEEMLASAVSPRRWEAGECLGCPFIARCHILSNATALRHVVIRQRLRRLLLAAHDAGAALPFRRLQGFLAYMITGGYRCTGSEDADAQVMRSDYAASEAVRARYYNLAFGLAPTSHESTRPEPLCRLLGPADPARLPAPEVDRLLGPAAPAGIVAEALGPGFRPDIEGSYLDGAASSGQDEEARADTVRYLKRLAFFACESSDKPVDGELGAALSRFARRFPWESFSTYDTCMISEGSDLTNALSHARSVIVRGLNALDDPKKAANEVLTAYQADPLELSRGRRLGLRYLLRRDPVPRVDRLPSPPSSALRYLEHRPAGLTLKVPLDDGDGHITLRLDLGLFEMLFAAANGFSAPQAFGTYLLDVRRFKERLIDTLGRRDHATSAGLVITGNGRDFVVSISRGPEGDTIDVLGG